MKIVIVCVSLGYGGAERLVIDTATRLSQRNHSVTIVSMLSNTPLGDEAERAGIRVIPLNMRRGVPNPARILQLAALWRSLKPDVVHSHGYPANILSRMARLICRTPVWVCTAHHFCESGRGAQFMYRLTDRLADLTTNVSKAAVDNYIVLRRVPKHRIRFIPNGVDFSNFRKCEERRVSVRSDLGLEDAFVWLAVGRLEKIKGFDLLLTAFASYLPRAQGRNVLLLVGEGECRRELELQTRELSLGQNLILLGVRRDIPAIMNAADACVMSSRGEGMPLVLIEASASELPIVATDVGGNREVVLGGDTGLLVPSENPRELATAMLTVRGRSDSERQRMGQLGREFVSARYDISKIVKQWERLYMELLGASHLPERPQPRCTN